MSGKTSLKTNLTSSPEFDVRAREPGDKANWLVESISKAILRTAISGVARVQRLPGHLVGVATCHHKVNFDPGFETA